MQQRVMGLLVCAGLSVSIARAGVTGAVWIEVDNSVATYGDAAGMETGLEGVRTFDLYAIMTPDTEIFAADFGFVSPAWGHQVMRSASEIYQNPLGGDTRSTLVGKLRMQEFAALEFDTYLSMGAFEPMVVRNAFILGADWTRAGFRAAWAVPLTSDTAIEPARADADGRLFLARISVYAPGSFGDMNNASELGGAFFLGGRDSHGGFGMLNPDSGKFWTQNAFAGPIIQHFVSSDDGGDHSQQDTGSGSPGDSGFDDGVVEPRDRFDGDMNGDGVVDGEDMAVLQGAFGTLNPVYDLNGDMLIEEHDVQMLLYLIDGTIPESNPTMTRQEQKKAARHYAKLMKKAKALVVKDRKAVEKERRKTLKKTVKELKKQQKLAKKAEKEAARAAKKAAKKAAKEAARKAKADE